MKKECIVCGEATDRPIAATLSHFALYQEGQWRFLSGNINCFGFISGLDGTLGLAFPIYNTLRHWKRRKMRLVIPEGADVCITREK